MGWMLKPKPATSNRSARGRAAARPPMAPARRKRLIRTSLWALAVPAIVAGWWMSHRALDRYVGDARAAVPQVALAHTPPWMTAALENEIRQIVAATVAPDPLDTDSLHAASQMLAQNPWVAQVHRVRRGYGGVIEIEAAFRQPAGVVEYAGRYELIDAHGYRLPATYHGSQMEQLELPVIIGVVAAPPKPGQVWNGADLQAGLGLAMLIEQQPYARQVQAFDVSNHNGRLDAVRPHLRMVTDRAAVQWGRAPGDEQFYEPNTQVKIEHINSVYRKYGSIDAGGQFVDVFGDTVLIHPSSSVRFTGGS